MKEICTHKSKIIQKVQVRSDDNYMLILCLLNPRYVSWRDRNHKQGLISFVSPYDT
jgi:hypothetical protein